jgi:small subunit ribosomal protein S16
MPTRIRLQRTGRKKQASFRIVVTDKAEANSGPALETLGTYNPRTEPSLIKLNTVSALHWLHEGARPTDTVVSIFKKTGVWDKYRAGATADSIVEEEAVVKLGSDPKTSSRAKAAAEGEKQAVKRRAEEKALAEAAARRAAEEKAAAAKAAAAEAAAAEAAEAEVAEVAEEAEGEDEVDAEAEGEDEA